jgi:hypothetical protein
VRGFIVGLAIFTLLVGLLFVVSPLARGDGFTVGAILGLILIGLGTARLVLEKR